MRKFINPIYRYPLLAWLFMISPALSFMGCKLVIANNPVRYSIEGTVWECTGGGCDGSEGWQAHLTFRDGTKINLENHTHLPIQANVKYRMEYSPGFRLLDIKRLSPVSEFDTVFNKIETTPAPNKDEIELPSAFIDLKDPPRDKWGIGSTLMEVQKIEGSPIRVSLHGDKLRFYYLSPQSIQMLIWFDLETGHVTSFDCPKGYANITTPIRVKREK